MIGAVRGLTFQDEQLDAELEDDGDWLTTDPDLAELLNEDYRPTFLPSRGTPGYDEILAVAARFGGTPELPPIDSDPETVY